MGKTIYVDGYEIDLDGLTEFLDMISGLEETEVVDVDVNGTDVTCTFANGEKQTAHCHSEDRDKWSLETGISVCLGKYLTGGSSEYNRIIRHGVKVFKDKVRLKAKEIDDLIEKERIRENKRRKHERYLKRREERRASGHDSHDEDNYPVLNLINAIAKDLGIEIEIVKV